MPSILKVCNDVVTFAEVLNLIITGMPSIQKEALIEAQLLASFKPYYNWNAFNTRRRYRTGFTIDDSFKPYYNWNAFNTKSEVIEAPSQPRFKPYYNWNAFNTIL